MNENAGKPGQNHLFLLNGVALAAPSIMRVICHCCAMDSTLLTREYSTSPAGKKKKKTLKAKGMICIILAWIGSAAGGLSLDCMNMEMPIKTGKT